MPTPDLQALIELSEKATPGEWRYRCKSNSWHLAPDPYTSFQYGESIMDPEDDWDSLKFEDIEFVQALVKWFRANESTLAKLTAPTLPGAGGGDDTARLDWLESQQGSNLVSDDDCRWAVSGSGFQPVPEEGGFTEDVAITAFVEPEEWKPTIRAAIDAALPPQQGG